MVDNGGSDSVVASVRLKTADNNRNAAEATDDEKLKKDSIVDLKNSVLTQQTGATPCVDRNPT